MRILVAGCGRGGTSLGIEVIRTLGIPCTAFAEDRDFFSRTVLPPAYGTKLTTEHVNFTIENLHKQLEQFQDLRIIFILRHPFDNVLSKIVRGQPKSGGGDNETECVMSDGTVYGASAAVLNMHSILEWNLQTYPDRVYVVKMEDLIINPHETVTGVAAYLGVDVTNESLEFYKYNRNKHHQRRYGATLAPQLNLYRDLKNNYGGFFVDRESDFSLIKVIFSEIAKKYEYSIEEI